MTEELQRITEYGIDEIRKDAVKYKDFESVYIKYFGTHCPSCPGEFERAYNKIKSKYQFIINNPTMSNCNFQFKTEVNRPVAIYSAHLHNTFTNANLTDEAAYVLLKENKEYKKHFEKMPEGWEQVLETFVMPKSFAESMKEEAPVEATAEVKEVAEVIEAPKKGRKKKTENIA